MGMLGVQNCGMMKGKRPQNRGRRNGVVKKDIKVTYISSPMKVKTSASNFRALVQELTGKQSNVAETFMEANGADNENENAQQWRAGVHDDDDEGYMPLQEQGSWLKPADYSNFQFPGSLLEPFNQRLLFDLL